MFKPKLREYAVQALRERSVEVRLSTAVGAVSPTRVTLASGEVIAAHTLVWGAGLKACQLAAALPDGQAHGARIPIGPELVLPGYPEVYVVGDVAAITDAKGRLLPQLGSVALQSGRHAGDAIARRIAGREPKPFAYVDKGTMAAIGRRAAVVQMLGGRTMTGLRAQVTWGAVHLAVMPGGEDRAKAIVDWSGAAITHHRPGRIMVESD